MLKGIVTECEKGYSEPHTHRNLRQFIYRGPETKRAIVVVFDVSPLFMPGFDGVEVLVERATRMAIKGNHKRMSICINDLSDDGKTFFAAPWSVKSSASQRDWYDYCFARNAKCIGEVD